MPYDAIDDLTYITTLAGPLTELTVSRGWSADLPVWVWCSTADSNWPIALSDQQAMLLASEILAALADTEEA